MQDLDMVGIFWPAASADKKVSGRLKFTAESGAELELLGTFENPTSFGMGQSSPMRIHGVSDDHLLTLDNCRRTTAATRIGEFGDPVLPTVQQETYYVQYIFDGCHFCEHDDMKFDAFRLKLNNLKYWIRKLRVSDRLVDGKGSKGAEKELHIVYSPMRNIEASTNAGEIKLEFERDILHEVFSTYRIRENSSVALHLPERTHRSNIVEDCFFLSHLVSIGIDDPVLMTIIEVSRKSGGQYSQLDSEQTQTNGKKWMKLYARLQPDVPEVEGKTHPSEILFPFDSIGGLEKVARWIEVARKYEMALGRLLLQRHSKSSLYADSMFFNAVSAAETLYRIQISKQHFKLKRCLKELASSAGDIFSDLVDDVDLWVTEVVETRVMKVVHRGLDNNIEASRLYWLSESLYFLVVICLLRECSVPDDVFDSIRNNLRFNWVASNVQNSS